MVVGVGVGVGGGMGSVIDARAEGECEQERHSWHTSSAAPRPGGGHNGESFLEAPAALKTNRHGAMRHRDTEIRHRGAALHPRVPRSARRAWIAPPAELAALFERSSIPTGR